MPAPITSRPSTKTVSSKSLPHNATKGKKSRVVRRRGRGTAAMDSDEEIEREARTDSESEDDLSSMVSSDSESDPEDIAHGSPHPLTPSTNESPQEASSLSKPVAAVNGHDSFFASSGNWSEMVAEETANGPADLPVIEFSQLDSHVVPVPSRKSKKRTKKDTLKSSLSTAQPSATEQKEQETSSVTTPSVTLPSSPPPPQKPFTRRPAGQSARQAYQQRLDADPSYVPTVGEFWGHDDRLLDKDLRSLSGWWRGKWQGRGRGRGFLRGRAGFRAPFRSHNGDPDADADIEPVNVPPVEQTWTHDGFEEMKQNEERRRHQGAQPQLHSPRGGFSRGRGLPLRGRGGKVHFSTVRPPSPSGTPRTWYSMKPEHMWTKQSEAFLYFESSLKARRAVRVKLPGPHSRSTKLPLKEHVATMPSPKPAVTSTTSVNGSDYGGNKHIQVRLPKGPEPTTQPPAPEPSIEDVFTVRPRLVPPQPIPLSEIPPSTDGPTHPILDPESQKRLEQVQIDVISGSDAHRLEEAVLRNTPREVNGEVEIRPDLPPIQTSFTPPVPPAYGNGSPYGYPQPLPPGIAVNSVGMTYELATGRPVYLPVPMYPPPHHQPPPFVPGHMSHRSTLSSEFIPHPVSSPSQHDGFMDYSTGQPYFSLPRQSSRIEIKAPDGSKANGTSELRTDAQAFEPSGQYYNPKPSEGDPPMVPYNPYQQYYYPDAYGYAPYMDMSHMGQYGGYASEVPQGTVYYQ